MTLTAVQRETLDRLLAALRDDELTRRQAAELEQIVLGDPEAMRYYVRVVNLNVGLRWMAEEKTGREGDKETRRLVDSGFSISPSPLPPSISLSSFLPSTPLGSFAFSYAMSAVLVGIGLFIFSLISASSPSDTVVNNNKSEVPRSHLTPNAPAPEPRIVSVARITGMVDCKWVDDHFAPFHDRVVLGTKYMLKSGLMEITYHTGAKVILQGPCTYEVESTAGGFLSLGKLTARVESRSRLPSGTSRSRLPDGTSRSRLPDGISRSRLPSGILPTDSNASKSRPAGGTYFAIRTPTATVTDLGTEFGVEVAKSGDTVSHVFVGKIRVKSVYLGGENNGREVILGVNESVRVEKSDADHNETPLAVHRGECDPGEFVRVGQMAAKLKEVQERPLKAFRQWQAFSEQIRRRDDLLAYYDFQRDADDPRDKNGCQIMRNRAKTGAKFDGLVWGTLRMGMAQGRFPGKQALKFGNQDDDVRLNIPVECRQMTLMAWINLDKLQAELSSLVMSDNITPLLCHWQVGCVNRIIGPAKFDPIFMRSSPVLIRGQWSFVATVCDCAAGKAVYYFNGEPCGDISAKKQVPPMVIGHASIGAWNHDNSSERLLFGRIDELMIFQSALSASEIRRLYEAAEPEGPGTGTATQRK